jgi:predicted Zn finger-like uncharacterized protein
MFSVSCPACDASYKVDEERIPKHGLKMRCPRCSNSFDVVHPEFRETLHGAGSIKVFLSWSGDRSKSVALALRDWLPNVIHYLEPWFSESDIDAGAFSDDEIRARLADAHFGVICVTPENLTRAWMNYEAGALAERLGGSVAPYLLGASPSDLRPVPLSRLQACSADELGTLKLVRAINASAGPRSLTKDRLEASFSKWWSDLAWQLEKLKSEQPLFRRQVERTLDEKVGEILALLQHQSYQEGAGRYRISKIAGRWEFIGEHGSDDERAAFHAAVRNSLAHERATPWLDPVTAQKLETEDRKSPDPHMKATIVGLTSSTRSVQPALPPSPDDVLAQAEELLRDALEESSKQPP